MSAATATSARTSGSVDPIPTSWVQALLMARYQLRDYLRSRRFVLMMGLTLGVSLVLVSLVAHFRPAGIVGTPASYYGGVWVGGVELLIIFAGVIFGGDAIAGEFQNKTGYYLMIHPIRRWSVFAGKYLAAYTASFATIVVYFAALVATGCYFFGGAGLSVGLVGSLLLAALYLAALLGMTFLFSSLFKTSLYGVLIVLVMFFFGFSVLSDLFANVVGITPWFILTWANKAISYPITGTAHSAGLLASNAIANPTLPQGIAVMVGYLVLTVIGGLLLFEREEFA